MPYEILERLPDDLAPNTIYIIRKTNSTSINIYETDEEGYIINAYLDILNNKTLYNRNINISANIYNKTNGLLIPYYIYPFDYSINDWNNDTRKLFNLINKYNQVPYLIIVNPNNGPGQTIDDKYQEFITNLIKYNAVPVGYIYFSYGQRNDIELLSDIDTWRKLYPDINALFIDEINNNLNNEDLIKLNFIIQYARIRGFNYIIINPGYPGNNNNYTEFKNIYADNILIYESNNPQLPDILVNKFIDLGFNKLSVIINNQNSLDEDYIIELTKLVKFIYICDVYYQLPDYLEDLIKLLDLESRILKKIKQVDDSLKDFMLDTNSNIANLNNQINQIVQLVSQVTNEPQYLYDFVINQKLDVIPNCNTATTLIPYKFEPKYIYLMPFVIYKDLIASGFGLYVTHKHLKPFKVKLALYDAQNNMPNNKLIEDTFTITNIGPYKVNTNLILNVNKLYYFALLSEEELHVRSIPQENIRNFLGIIDHTYEFITHLKLKVRTFNLPDNLLNYQNKYIFGTKNIPAIFLST